MNARDEVENWSNTGKFSNKGSAYICGKVLNLKQSKLIIGDMKEKFCCKPNYISYQFCRTLKMQTQIP